MCAEILVSASSKPTAGEIVASLEKDGGYTTPKIDVVIPPLQDPSARGARLDTMPGGRADVGEAHGSAVVREGREESGFDIRVRKLVAVLDRYGHGHPPIARHA